MADLKNIGGQPAGGLTSAHQAALFGTGVNQPILPNQNRGETGDQDQQGSPSGEHAELAAAIQQMGQGTMARVATRLANRMGGPQKPGTDNVLRNLNGQTTVVRGTLNPERSNGYNKYYNKEFQGRRIVARGEIPSDWSSQISAGMTSARVNRADPNVLAQSIAA
ncbi:MAG: hypothetical protein U1E65_08355 [Myxococcota bacterium]